MYMKRTQAAQVGRETLDILERGFYTVEDQRIEIQESLQAAIANTCSYPPGESPHAVLESKHATRFQVLNTTTLKAAHQLVQEGHSVAILNFASAKNPGGGFQNGARAQEESLARSSGLFPCIDGNAMYTHHRSMRSCMYTDYAIYSPNVPIIRNDEGDLLQEPYLGSFITSPAVNAKIVLQRERTKRNQIRDAMYERIEKILDIAAEHKHTALVLGAWGCGVFGNSVEDIAACFEEALMTTFKGQFKAVAFAILDSSKQQRFIKPFLHHFGEQSLSHCTHT